MARANVRRVSAALTLRWRIITLDPTRLFANLVDALRRGEHFKDQFIGDILQTYKSHPLPPEVQEYAGGRLNKTIMQKPGRKPHEMSLRVQRDYPPYQRFEELRAQGKRYDEALEITHREFNVAEGTLRERLTILRGQLPNVQARPKKLFRFARTACSGRCALVNSAN